MILQKLSEKEESERNRTPERPASPKKSGPTRRSSPLRHHQNPAICHGPNPHRDFAKRRPHRTTSGDPLTFLHPGCRMVALLGNRPLCPSEWLERVPTLWHQVHGNLGACPTFGSGTRHRRINLRDSALERKPLVRRGHSRKDPVTQSPRFVQSFTC